MQNVIYTLLAFFFLTGTTHTANAQKASIIPYPEEVTGSAAGYHELKDGTITYTDPALSQEASFLSDKLSLNNLSMQRKEKRKAKKGILLSLNREMLSREAYTLCISPELIRIEGGGPQGVFYGIQSLLQLIRHENGTNKLACRCIKDVPRFAWRGYMLDESRHFFGKEKVKQLLDLMAYYKLNKFHWHLTDESGWRIEIKRYPFLAKIGGIGNWSDPDFPEARFYTQDDIREIVAYASALHIEIIPEIDMPGHATAANKAYPEYSGGGTGEHPDFTFNVGKDETYTYLTNILREITGLFPSRYLHIGGDEVAFGIKAWETDPHIQAMMKKEGLKTVKEAERYFMQRITDSVKVLGKVVTGWDELLDLQADPSRTLIMWWRHDRVNTLKQSLASGYYTILCPRRPLYFDFIQDKTHKWGRVWNGFCPLEDVYSFPDKGFAAWNLDPSRMQYIRGIQANAWTERIHTAERLDFMTFPRICALAEAAWTCAEAKDFDSFNLRMEDAYRLFDSLNLYYFDPRNPERHPEPAGAVKKQKEVPMDFRD